MTAGFTSKLSADTHIYFIKAFRLYPSVLCLYCDKVEVSDHVFSCKYLLEFHISSWKAVSGFSHFSLGVLQLLFFCVSDPFVSTALYKDFVFDGWFCKAVFIFRDSKIASLKVVKFVHSLGLAFRADIWSVYAKHHTYMKKNKLILLDGLTHILVSGLASRFSAGVIKLLGIADGFGICFGFRKSSLFFSGLSDLVLVYIAA
ncbi:hypothetical protein G9A89_008891 [Geosiphon pyriformis]|nr:hypothetical protein G9A89_008891 [Geosiphon pyriformis]